MKLNLGCGFDHRKGFVNVDSFSECKPELVHDLNKKFPFEDNSIEEILALDVIEHLDNPVSFLNECHRILKQDGKMVLQVPHFRDISAYRPQHKHFFSRDWFVRGLTEPFAQIKPFQIESTRLVFTTRPNPIIEFIPNLFPRFWERFLGATGVRVILIKKSQESTGKKPETSRNRGFSRKQ